MTSHSCAISVSGCDDTHRLTRMWHCDNTDCHIAAARCCPVADVITAIGDNLWVMTIMMSSLLGDICGHRWHVSTAHSWLVANLSGLINVCQLFYNYLGYSSVQLESSPVLGGGMLCLIMIGRCGEEFIKLFQTPGCFYVKSKLLFFYLIHIYILPLNDLGQLADHYCHCFF